MNHDLEQLKKEYQSNRPSEEWKRKIERLMKRKKRIKTLLRISTPVAAACLLFVTSLNLVPAFAQGVAEIPGMQSVVKVLTFGRYQVNDKNITAEITMPQIEGLLDKKLEEQINRDFKEQSSLVISAFEQDYKDLKAQSPDAHYGVKYDFEMLCDNENYLSMDVYWVNMVGSSYTVKKYYTIDKQSGKLLKLSDLFLDGADYQTPLSNYLKDEMIRQNTAGENQFWIDDDGFAEPFKMIQNEQKFYINQKGSLVICFDKYEIGPGSSGNPEFIIPDQVIDRILK